VNRTVRKTLFFNILVLGLYTCLQRLVPCGSLLLSCPLEAARDLVGLLALFFVPGTAIALALPGRWDGEAFELLARGFGLNVIILTSVTTAAKLAGLPVDAGLIVGAALFFLVLAAILLFLRGSPVEVRGDAAPSLKAAVLVAALFLLLFASLSGYTTLGPPDHWLIERFEKEDRPLPPSGAVSAKGGGRFARLEDGRGGLTYVNRSGGPLRVVLKIMVESGVPGIFTVSSGLRETSFPVPQPFFDRGREVRFQKHAVVSAPVELEPGENWIGLRYEGRGEGSLPCEYLDFTLLDGDEFRKAFLKRYRFVNYVLMYDIMEAEDFVSNLSVLPYIYHSPGTPELPGYAPTNPPLSYLFSSYGWSLLGGGMASVNKVSYALLAALLLASFRLSEASRAARGPMVLGALSLAVVMTAGVSLHFMTGFMMFCLLLSFYFMLRGKAGWYLLFSVLACLSTWGGYYFCALGLFWYALLQREWRWSLIQFAWITVCLAAFVSCLLAFGASQGVLKSWLDVILWENFRRFGTAHLYQAGSRLCFFKYAVIGSGFLPLCLFFKNDREGCFFLLFTAVYCGTLLLAPSNEWKIHYLPTLVFPVMIAASRALTLGGKRRRMVARLVGAAIWACAAAGFLYVFRLALEGGLIVC
jgi:hypothetical protein